MEIQEFINRYSDGYVRINRDVSYSLQDIINKNIQNYNRQFENPYFVDGTKKLFYPLSYIMARTLFENTDIDTDDIEIHAENLASINVVSIIKPAVKQHLKDTNYGETINQIRQEMIDMGHVIVKEVLGESKIVNLQNIVRPPHMMDIQDGSVAEQVLMTWDDVEMNKKNWEDKWEEIEDLQEVMIGEAQYVEDTKTNSSYYLTSNKNRYGASQNVTMVGGAEVTYFKVYEYWTRDWFEVNGEKIFTKGCIKYLDTSLLRPEDMHEPFEWQAYCELERFASPFYRKIRTNAKLKQMKKAGVELIDGDKVRVYPYEEQRLITVQGRWLGVGVYELTAPMQEQFNEIYNNKRRIDELKHKGIMVHRQPSNGNSGGLTQEFISSLPTGGIISVEQDEDLVRLSLGELTNDFIESGDKVFEMARQVAGVTASGTGEEMPASTTATIGVINQQKAKSTFDVVIEQQSLFFKRLFENFKLESILNDLTSERWVKLLGDPMELKALEESYVKNYAYTKVNEAISRGEFVKPEDIDLLIQALQAERAKQGVSFAQLKKDLVRNLDTTVKFVITNESFDKLNRIRELQTAIANAIQDPNNMLSIPRMQEELLDLLNLSGSKYRMTQEELRERAANEERRAMIEAKGVGTPKGNPTVLSAGQTFGNNAAMA